MKRMGKAVLSKRRRTRPPRAIRTRAATEPRAPRAAPAAAQA